MWGGGGGGDSNTFSAYTDSLQASFSPDRLEPEIPTVAPSAPRLADKGHIQGQDSSLSPKVSFSSLPEPWALGEKNGYISACSRASVGRFLTPSASPSPTMGQMTYIQRTFEEAPEPGTSEEDVVRQ